MVCPRCGTETTAWPCPECGFPEIEALGQIENRLIVKLKTK